MTGENDNRDHGFRPGALSGEDASSTPYSHRKEEEVRSFFALCLATILLAAPFGLAVILLERPMDDPILISVYFWLGLAALIYYPFLILRSPAEIYIADAYDDTATRMARIVGVALFAYALMWGANLLLLTNTSPWRTMQGPLARIEIVPTNKWTEDRHYEFRFQLTNVPGWFHYRDRDPARIQQIYDRLMHVERAGPFLMDNDEEVTSHITDEGPVPIADAVKNVEAAVADSEDMAKAAEMAPGPQNVPGTTLSNTPDAAPPSVRLSVGFRADHGWVNAVVPPAWAFLGENTKMDIKALMLDDDLVIFDKSRSLTLRITSLIWFIMCVMAGSASFLAARLRGLKGQEAEADKRMMMNRRAEETRAFEEKLAELGLDGHLTEIQKSARIHPVHKKDNRPQ